MHSLSARYTLFLLVTNCQTLPFYLEVILFLTDECVVRIAKIKTFVGVHPVMRYRQFFEIVIAKNVPGCLLKRVKSNALITGVDVIAVGDFVAVQHRAAAATAVLHSAQFGFLKNNRMLERKKRRMIGVNLREQVRVHLFDVNKTILAEFSLLRSRLQGRVQRVDAGRIMLVRQLHQGRSYLRLRRDIRRSRCQMGRQDRC